MKKLLALVLALVLAISMFSGCSTKGTKSEGGEGDGYAVNEMANTVDDSSDLPDWTGKKLELKFWHAQGTAAANRAKKATNDVVTPEIFRVTGVKFSESESMDNNGELMDAKIAKMMAANDWPDIVGTPEKAVLEKMIEADLVYDLTDYLEEYCPNIMAMATKYGDKYNYMKSKREDGKIYLLPTGVSLTRSEKDLPAELTARVQPPTDAYPRIYVRDDILKMIYPEAKTQDEIEEMFVKNGKFSEEEVFDIPINSKDEFFNFLDKIKALNLKAGNYDVYPTYVADGYDNWSLLTVFGSLYGYNVGGSLGANYFTYWDNNTEKVDYFYKQPAFKEVVKEWTQKVRDGIASPESLIDNRSAFEQKVYNGAYAVLYGSPLPEQNQLNKTLEEAGKDFKYRKVYLNIAPDTKNYTFGNAAYGTDGIAILKNGQIKEEDLPQVLRFFDFSLSQAGQKLEFWGPRSAGLFEEVDGKRVYTNKEVENAMVYGAANDMKVYYNLNSAAWPGYPRMSGSKYDPRLIYDLKITKTLANKYFSAGVVRPFEFTEAVTPNIWTFDAYGVDGVQTFWQSRQVFEDAIKRIFVTETDADFEAKYQEMVNLATKNGLTDETAEEVNRVYREVINAEFMENLK